MSVRSRLTALATASFLVATATAVVVPSPAQALVTGGVTGGTASWQLSEYLNSANPGRPNPSPASYVAPATFDAATRISTWGAGTGVVAPDGSADLAFDGTSVNHATTGGGWLELSDLEADLDSAGNGTVSAVVSYGLAAPPATFDPAQAPVRGPQRVALVELTGNTPADRSTTPAATTWTGLDGVWTSEFLAFLAGTGTNPTTPWQYASTVTNTNPAPTPQTPNPPQRTPAPFTFTTTTETPAVTATVTGASYSDGLTVGVVGTGFRAVTNPAPPPPGDAGVYVGIAESGGLPDVSSQDSAANFVAFAYAMPADIVDGALAKSLNVPTDALDPATSYSVYTWQAHTHSNTTQDTETPLAIDWAALERIASTTTAAGPTKRAYGRTSTLTATVSGPGSVTLTGVGPRQEADVVDGKARFTVPAALRVGSYTATLTYSGGGDYLASRTTARMNVTKATPKLRTAWTPKPTVRKAGKVRVTVAGPAAVAAPTGKVSVRLSRAGSVRTLTGRLRDGVVTIAVPRLAKGTWTVRTAYAGAAAFTAAKRSASLLVK